MGEMGFGYGEVEKRGIVSPVAGVSVSYKKPVLLMMKWRSQFCEKVQWCSSGACDMNFIMQREMRAVRAASSKHCFTKDGKLVSLKREIPELDELFRKSLKGENA